MNIMYLTTARHPEDYSKLLERVKNGPNPSNQNFHTKLINLLRLDHNIHVLSSRPMAKNIILGEHKHDIYTYPFLINVPFVRRASFILASLPLIQRNRPKVIFVDTLNVSLLKLAKRAKTLFGVKLVGIVTDNPINLTGSRKSYSEDVFKYSKECDAYICLTDGLARLFEVGNKPHVIIPGFVSDDKVKDETHEEYAFFAGALYAKYGVDTLIEAFRTESAPLKLIIAGHGPLAENLRRNPHPNIEFLGHITPEVASLLSRRAKVNINPRPADSQIDTFSVPSKVIDFINSGTVTISTENSEIRKLVGDSIYWISDHESSTIRAALTKINKDYEFYRIRALTARKEMLHTLAPIKVGQTLNELLLKL